MGEFAGTQSGRTDATSAGPGAGASICDRGLSDGGPSHQSTHLPAVGRQSPALCRHKRPSHDRLVIITTFVSLTFFSGNQMSQAGFPLTPNTDVFTFVKYVQNVQNCLCKRCWQWVYVQNSKLGCKYTSSFRTLTEHWPRGFHR